MLISVSSIRKFKLEDLQKPKTGIYMIYVDHWWIIDKDGNVLLYLDHWQCNSNENVAKTFRDNVYPDLDVVQVPVVYTPYNY